MAELDNESVNADELQIEDVTDAELDAAFRGFMGDDLEEPDTTVNQDNELKGDTLDPGEMIPQTPTHPEASRLGRKVKYVEENMVSKSEFRNLNSKIDTLLEQLNRKPVVKEVDEFGEEIEPKVDIEELVDRRIVESENKRIKRNKEAEEIYQLEYIDELKTLINEIEDPVVARQVFKKMTEEGGEFNKKLSLNPLKDCSKNFIRAIKSVSTPFSGKRGASVPAGISVSSTNTDSARKIPKMDKEAEEFAKASGLTDDEIFEALEGEMPAKLRGTNLRM